MGLKNFHFSMCKSIVAQVFLLGLILIATSASRAAEIKQNYNLFDMSLEDLLDVKVKVPSALTEVTWAEQPSSITTISSEQISITPARNILDLIEIYVPGALWMNSEIGPVLGMRGSLLNRNLKYLLLVNGRVMNSKGFFGAKSELEQWALGDIEKIDVIRGPGSVTYGPGAVSGVISITTKNSTTSDDDYLSVQYSNQYDSKGVSYSQNHQFEHFELYSFASITRTKGDDANFFLVDDNEKLGYVGRDFLPDAKPLDYFNDYQDEPQLKLYLDSQLTAEWRAWLRYTQQGSSWKGNELKTQFDSELLNQQGVRDRQWTFAVEYETQLSDSLRMTSNITLDSFDAERRIGKARFTDPESVLNFKLNYAETELLLHNTFNWQVDKSMEIAAGIEYSYDDYGTGWGDSDKDLRMGDNSDIVSGPDSNAILAGNKGSADKDGTALYVGNGWSTDTYALFTEVNKSFADGLRLILSTRFDKSSHSKWLFSPRISVSKEFTKGHYLHLIAQQSHRLNNAGQVLTESRHGQEASSESLSNIEISYRGFLDDNHIIQSTLFWNDLENISWNGDINASVIVGDQKVAGLEVDYTYRWNSGSFGLNYSYVKQQEWQLAPDLTSSGISYSDYNQLLKGSNAIQTGVGNNANNWPNSALKAFVQWNITERLKLHVNAQLFSELQGAKDGLKGFELAMQNEPEQQVANTALARVKDVHTYDSNYRTSAALLYQWQSDLELIISVQSLFSKHKYHRYAEDSGNNDAAPRRVRFTEEPLSFAIEIKYTL